MLSTESSAQTPVDYGYTETAQLDDAVKIVANRYGTVWFLSAVGTNRSGAVAAASL